MTITTATATATNIIGPNMDDISKIIRNSQELIISAWTERIKNHIRSESYHGKTESRIYLCDHNEHYAYSDFERITNKIQEKLVPLNIKIINDWSDREKSYYFRVSWNGRWKSFWFLKRWKWYKYHT